MIVARRLSKRFGRFHAVDSVDFEIPRGQVVGFLGPNGAGKTTTIRMIAGFLAPTAGLVRIDGLEVSAHRNQVQRQIGYLPESAPLYTEMRVEEYLRFRGRLFGIPRAGRSRAIEVAVERCSLGEVRGRPIGQLSRGYRQRVGLAAALLHEPAVLILDEPTVGLDPAQILEVRRLIRQLAGRHTILLSTHILPEAEQTCDRIMMMARGRIRAAGTIDELRAAASPGSRLTVETDQKRAPEVLAGLQGVSRVQTLGQDGPWQRLEVIADDALDLRESVFGVLARNGAAIRELRVEAPSLEHLFIRMLADAEIDFARREGNRQGARA